MGYKDLIIETCRTEALLRNEAAYVLGTTEWETNGTFEPVREAYWVPNAESWRRKNLRYYPWYGRGFVQLTWEDNYRKAGEAIGVDLLKDPDAAMEPGNAAKILVLGMKHGWFTGKKLSDFITLRRSDFAGARAIVNGTDKRDEIASLARKHNAALKLAGYGVEPSLPSWTPKPDVVSPERSSAPTWLSVIIGIVVAFFRGLGRK